MRKTMKELQDINDKIMSVKEFTVIIEGMVLDMKCSYLDALTWYSESNGIEIETVGALVKSSHVLKAKLAAESEEMNLIESTGSKLPV